MIEWEFIRRIETNTWSKIVCTGHTLIHNNIKDTSNGNTMWIVSIDGVDTSHMSMPEIRALVLILE